MRDYRTEFFEKIARCCVGIATRYTPNPIEDILLPNGDYEGQATGYSPQEVLTQEELAQVYDEKTNTLRSGGIDALARILNRNVTIFKEIPSTRCMMYISTRVTVLKKDGRPDEEGRLVGNPSFLFPKVADSLFSPEEVSKKS